MGDLPIFGTTVRRVSRGRSLHRVPTDTVFAGLREDCVTFLAPDWYACVLLEDGQGVMRGRSGRTKPPPLDVQDKLLAVADMLNREHHENGHWITAFAGGRMHMLWRDGDGDLQYTFEIDEPWVRVRVWPDTEFADRATVAHRQWQEQMRAADRKPEEMIRRALGEKSGIDRLN